MAKPHKDNDSEQSTQGLSPLTMLFSEVERLYTRSDTIADKVNKLAGQMSIVNKIVWLLFALVLTAAATGAINHIINIIRGASS
jgi:hypothetical protein